MSKWRSSAVLLLDRVIEVLGSIIELKGMNQ
jgi:hypothetical protein